MKTSNDRAVIMNMLGDLVDRIDSYNAWIEVKGFYAEEVDKQFSVGLQRFINDMSKFHRIWEERY